MIGTIAYDNLGRRTSLTLGNGVATNYAYDTASRLAQLKLELPGTADDLTSTFEYNPASQIAKNIRSNDAYAWTGHGSGTTSTTSNGLNQIGSWVSTLGYDSKGNVTSDGTYTYGYSSENLLTSLANSASGALQPNIAFAYDPLMRLAAIDSSNAVFDVQFGYDGQEMVYEGLSDNRTRRYVYGPGTDEPLVGYLVTPTGTSRLWYQADERGSIVRLSNDSGAGGIGRFDEYGVGGASRFRYTGQYWLGEANLLYYRARIYDARLGRFLQPDPIGYGGGMNMYAYVQNDPINTTDPSGTIDCGLESNWRSGDCADKAVAHQIRTIGESNGYTNSEIRASTSRVLDHLHGRTGYTDTALALLQIEAGVNSMQGAGSACPGRFQCEDKPTRQMNDEAYQLIHNATFISALRHIEQQANRTGNEWGFTGKGRKDFQLVGGYFEGTKDWIAAAVIAERARGGCRFIFPYSPEFGLWL